MYPNEPDRPKALTDRYIVALHSWANKVLGVATQDRIRWKGERDCLNELRDAGQIR